MAFVALQFDKDQILVAGARANGKRLQIQSLFSVDLNGDVAAAAESLKSKLSQLGLSRSDAIIVVSRADAEMRELVVPPAPDNEVPDMVRFIARSEFASLNENWSLDYLPMSGDSNSQRTVLAIGISPELQKQQEKIATAAGLKIKHIVLRPFASVDLIRSRLTGDECRLIVDPNGDQTDMTIVAGDSVLATRTVRIPQSADAEKRATSLLSEVRRTLASSSKTMGERKVSQVFVFGEAKSNKSLEGNLRGQLELDVEFLDPISFAPLASGVDRPAEPERFAGLIGSLIQDNSNHKHVVDFVNPRRPVVRKNDYSKWYLWGGIAAAASLMAVVFGWWVLSGQAKTIADLEGKLVTLKNTNAGDPNKDIPSVDQVLSEISKIDSWKASDINWLEEMSEFSQRSLTPDELIVDKLDAHAGLSTTSSPRMTMAIRSISVDKEQELTDDLQARPYSVAATGSRMSGDESYPLAANVSVEFRERMDEHIKKFDEKAMEHIKAKLESAQEDSGSQ